MYVYISISNYVCIYSKLILLTDVFRESSPPTSTPHLIKSPSHPEPLFVESYNEDDGHMFQRQYAKRLKKPKPKEKEATGNSKETTKTVEKSNGKEKESSGVIRRSKQSSGMVGRPQSEPVARQPALKHPQVR